jgi:ABC-type spermidine/putrescine transport system permease subunit I
MMLADNPVLTSTLILTLLLAVGLFFFIRASTKDRIEQMILETGDTEEILLPRLQQYFTDRAYKLKAVEPDTEIVTFEGFVRPSVFLAVLLTGLAAIGAMCLALVLSMLFPDIGRLFLLLLLVAPVAGWFYWQGSSRVEQIRLKVEPQPGEKLPTAIRISGHRDELAVFQETLQLCVRDEIK